MAKARQPAAPQPEGGAAALTELADLLEQVRLSLDSANGQLGQLAASLAAALPAGGTGVAPTIQVWEDDSFSETVVSADPVLAPLIEVPVPTTSNPRMRINIVEPQPAPGRYAPGTPEFLYWSAFEALARGIDFWTGLLPQGTTWSTSNPMRVQLVVPQPQLNAYYVRASGLEFYLQTVRGQDVYSGQSPDVVCHELGHAVLDALKPQLFQTASTETEAFHESFGDMSAILCALQVPSLRVKVLQETGGKLNVNSRLSRVAEQLGWGIRQQNPTAVDRDSLRNAANRFFYRPPSELPPSAPSNLLSAQRHSFSRVFTGAFLDALTWMFETSDGSEASLLAAGRDIGLLLVDGVHTASITPAYFSQVAAAMIQAEQSRFAGRYRPALTQAFMKRGILSVNSGMSLANQPLPSHANAPATALGMAAPAPSLLHYEGAAADEAFRLGLGETPDLPLMPVSLGALTIEVHAAQEAARFEVAAALTSSQAATVPDVETASRIFLEGLIQRGELDLGPIWRRLPSGAPMMASEPGPRRAKPTHELVEEGGRLVLKRNCFSCGGCDPDAGRWRCD